MVRALAAVPALPIYSPFRAGCFMLFLPPYSPDLNPIKESFSLGKFCYIHAVNKVNNNLGVKAWLRRHWQMARNHPQPDIMLLEACSQITVEKAVGWIRHARYNM